MKKRVMFVGGGAMAGAILAGLKNAGKDLSQVHLYDPSQTRMEELKKSFGLIPVTSSAEGAADADIVILAVKPQVLLEVLEEIQPSLRAETVVASIAAGITLSSLEKALPNQKVVRVMPNTPLMIGEGMSGICGGRLAELADVEAVTEIFSASGKTLIVPEKQMDALSGISGCGPAFTYLFIEALMDAGVLNGLSRKDALLLAAQTVQGSARMILETGEEPAALKGQVTSPGGTTIAGVCEMEKAGVRGTMMEAVTATVKRSKELSNG